MNKTIFSILIVASMASLNAEGKHKGGHGSSQSMSEEAHSAEGTEHGHDNGGHGGGGHGAGAHWMSPDSASAMKNPIHSDAASIDRGKKSYFQYCASCHGAKAMGDGPAAASLNPKPTNLKAMSGGHPDGDFAWKIENGRGAMPAWKGVLNKNQIWDLVNYIQNLNPNGKPMDMSKMDHSKMSPEEMKKMMSNMGHSNTDGHHDAKPDSHSSGKKHSH